MITSTARPQVVAGTRYLADVTVSSEGISGWLKDNALPLIMLIIGLGLLGASRKGDTSKVMLTIGLVASPWRWWPSAWIPRWGWASENGC